MSEPFSEEDVGKDVMNNWVKHFGLKPHQIHASGHCPSKDLTHIINKIQPKKLIPIHTEHPTLFKDLFKHLDVTIVEKRKQYAL
jgi:ribonuclease J